MSEAGWLLQFGTDAQLTEALKACHERGYRIVEAYSPFPNPEYEELVEAPVTRVSLWMFAAGCFGAALAFGGQSWAAMIAYPIHVAGTPPFSWPAFLAATFESAVLLSAFTGFIVVLALSGLPRFHHPVFDAFDFRRATSDLYYLRVECSRDEAEALGGTLHEV